MIKFGIGRDSSLQGRWGEFARPRLERRPSAYSSPSRNRPPHGTFGRIFIANSIRGGSAIPFADYDKMSGDLVILEQAMTDITAKVRHIRPNLADQPLRYRCGFGLYLHVPDHRDRDPPQPSASTRRAEYSR
jgi:hypothetical protein